jgi:hypothetical protein|tara:strand:+ start:975 stop:1265 length:291 start_codon:yes stop_codon:yes gene_type:complete
MGKQNRKKIKKPKLFKTQADRAAEILDITEKLKNLGLDERYDEIKEFNILCQKYIEDGLGLSGKVKITGAQRIIEYIFPTRKETRISIKLKYDKHV